MKKNLPAFALVRIRSLSLLHSLLLSLMVGFANLFLPTLALAADWEKVSAEDFRMLPPPDAAASAVEIDELLKLQVLRTKEECALGEKQSDTDFSVLFADTSLLSKLEISALAPLMSRIKTVGENVSHVFKDLYRRNRPFKFDARVQPCVRLPGSPNSYPSSHALLATLDACVLASIFPKFETEFKLLATKLSDRRMKIGVHFASDVRAGEKLGLEICAKLSQDQEFQTEVDAARRAL